MRFRGSFRGSPATEDTKTQGVNYESQENRSENGKEKDGTDPDDDPDPITVSGEEGDETKDSAQDSAEASAEESISAEDTKKEETSDTEEEITEEETTTEEETEDPATIVGLRKFFQNKLIVNSEKASLYLNVRAEPNEDSDILSVLYPNDIAKYIRKTGNWYEIEREGYTGYVNASYVYTDKQAYDLLVHSVAYAAMVKTYESFLYAVPNSQSEIILCAHKSDAFRLRGITGGFYEVEVVSELYDTLYMPMDNAIVYYLFLGQGNSNELGEHEESFFGTLDVEENLERSEELIEEYAEDLQEYKNYLASSEYESYSAEQAYLAASRSAAQAAAEAARQSASSAAEAAKNTGDAQYIGRFYITHYCHCQQCCGIWGSNDPNYQAYGSSGMKLVPDYTVAVNSGQIPYGTRLLINGKEYITADTGAMPNNIDIYRRTHAEALAGGAYYADVYILP